MLPVYSYRRISLFYLSYSDSLEELTGCMYFYPACRFTLLFFIIPAINLPACRVHAGVNVFVNAVGNTLLTALSAFTAPMILTAHSFNVFVVSIIAGEVPHKLC